MDKRLKKHIDSGEILRLYEEGTGLELISKTVHSSQSTVKKVLLHFGINYDLIRKKAYKESLSKALELYKQGKSQVFIEKELSLTRKTIRELIKSTNIKYRDLSEQKFIDYGTELDESVFDKLSPEALYWIGLLFADGRIEKKEYSISLTLDNKDYYHLENFKRFLKSNRKITKDNGDCSRVRINSKKLWYRLKELGFTHNKSEVGKPHELLKHSEHFWRGVIDGDGGVYNYSHTNQISLCGTLETIFDFIIFCSEELKIKDKYPSASNKEGYKKETLFQVHYYSKDCKKVLDLLYKDATVYLDRKYETYLEMCQENKN
jgi:hypothetical protein